LLWNPDKYTLTPSVCIIIFFILSNELIAYCSYDLQFILSNNLDQCFPSSDKTCLLKCWFILSLIFLWLPGPHLTSLISFRKYNNSLFALYSVILVILNLSNNLIISSNNNLLLTTILFSLVSSWILYDFNLLTLNNTLNFLNNISVVCSLFVKNWDIKLLYCFDVNLPIRLYLYWLSVFSQASYFAIL